MMFNTPTILAFGLTFVLAIVAYYFYSLKQELLARLLHGGQEFDKLQKQMQNLSNDHEKVLNRQNEKNLGKNKTHKTSVSDSDKYKLLVEQNLKTVEQLNKDIERFKNTEEHLRLQVQSLTEQLKGSEQERIELQKQSRNVQAQAQAQDRQAARIDRQAARIDRQVARSKPEDSDKITSKLESQLKILDKEKQDLADSLSEKRRELKKYQHLFEKFNPKEFSKYKRQHQNYAHLYNSMKGLKEMAEERSANFELASRALSTWILAEKEIKPSSEQLGALVTQALESIGVAMVQDAFTAMHLQNAASPSLSPSPVAIEQGAGQAN
ncbi:MAG: hypothetical protein KBD78_03265 [Oligoflexales bacterium]|nr:hypothetical protein [Oligoflexales bacterium]